jgi:hypothetical protein
MLTTPTEWLRRWHARCFIDGIEHTVEGSLTRSMSLEQPRSSCSVQLKNILPEDVAGKKCWIDISISPGGTGARWRRFFTGYAAPDSASRPPVSNALNIVDALWKLDRSPIDNFTFWGTPLSLAYRVVLTGAGIGVAEVANPVLPAGWDDGVISIVAPIDYVTIEATENLLSIFNELNEYAGLAPLVMPDGQVRLFSKVAVPEEEPSVHYSSDKDTITDDMYRIYRIERGVGMFDQAVTRVIASGNTRTDGWTPAGMWEFASEDIRGKTDSRSGRWYQTDAQCVAVARRELQRLVSITRTYTITAPTDPDVMPGMSILVTSPKYSLVTEPMRIISVNVAGAEMTLTCSAGPRLLGSGETLGSGGGSEDGGRDPGDDPGDNWDTPPDNWNDTDWSDNGDWNEGYYEDWEDFNDGIENYPDEYLPGMPPEEIWQEQPSFEDVIYDPNDPSFDDNGDLPDFESDIDFTTNPIDEWGPDWEFDWAPDDFYDFMGDPVAVAVLSVIKETVIIGGTPTDLYDVTCSGLESTSSAEITSYAWSTTATSDPGTLDSDAAIFFTAQDITNHTVTLTVTDANGSGSTTVAIPQTSEDNVATALSVATGADHRYFDGETWITATFPFGVTATSIAVPPIGGFPLLASNGKLYAISVNDNTKLVQWGNTPPSVGAACVWLNEQDTDDCIIAGTNLARTFDGGDAWSEITGPGGSITHVQLGDDAGTGYIRVVTSAGCYHSFDGGASWELAASLSGATRSSSAPWGHVTVGSSGAVFDTAEGVTVGNPAGSVALAAVTPGYVTNDFVAAQSDGTLYQILPDGSSSTLSPATMYATSDMIRDGYTDAIIYATGSAGTYKLLARRVTYLLDSTAGQRIGYGLGTARPGCQHCGDAGQLIGTSIVLNVPDPITLNSQVATFDVPSGPDVLLSAVNWTNAPSPYNISTTSTDPGGAWVTSFPVLTNPTGSNYRVRKVSGAANVLLHRRRADGSSVTTTLSSSWTSFAWPGTFAWFDVINQFLPGSGGDTRPFTVEIEEDSLCPEDTSAVVFPASCPFTGFSWTTSDYSVDCSKQTSVTLGGGDVFDDWCFKVDKAGVAGLGSGYAVGQWNKFGSGFGATLEPTLNWTAAGDEFILELCPPEDA